MTACPLGKPPLIATASSPALVRLALVHLLDLDDVGVAEVLLLADHVRLADARQEGDGLVVLGEGGGRVVEDRVVVVLLAVAGRESGKDVGFWSSESGTLQGLSTSSFNNGTLKHVLKSS